MDEFQAGWHYWRNVAINVVGFIPLGFFFQAYFSAVGKIKRQLGSPLCWDSSSASHRSAAGISSDPRLGSDRPHYNTFGTALGATLCVWSIKHNWFAKSGLPSVHPLDKY